MTNPTYCSVAILPVVTITKDSPISLSPRFCSRLMFFFYRDAFSTLTNRQPMAEIKYCTKIAEGCLRTLLHTKYTTIQPCFEALENVQVSENDGLAPRVATFRRVLLTTLAKHEPHAGRASTTRFHLGRAPLQDRTRATCCQ